MNRLLNGTLCVTLALGAGLAQAQSTLRVGLNADIRSTEPGVNRDENTDTVMLHIVEALVQAYIFGTLALIYIAGGMQSHEASENPEARQFNDKKGSAT